MEFTSEQFNNIKNEAEDFYNKIGFAYCPYFAEKVNFNAKGLEHLITLLKNPHLMSRAWKVVNEGYPSMTPELTERLEKRGYVNPLSN